MSDTITANVTTAVVRAADSRTLPVGTRIQCVTLEGSLALQNYTGEIGTIVSHAPGNAPLVEFETSRSGDNKWYVTSWRVLPAVGQRVTVTECLEHATTEFTSYAVGREATYLSTDRWGAHTVAFPDDIAIPSDAVWDFPNPASVAVVRFDLGAEVEALTSSEPVTSLAERDREARAKYDALVEAINDLAEQEEWCGNFEEWAERHDVPVRRTQDKTYNVNVDLTYEIDADTVAAFLRREFGGDHDDVSADDVTVTSRVTVTMTLSGETPDDADSYTVENALTDADFSGWSDWSITSYEES